MHLLALTSLLTLTSAFSLPDLLLPRQSTPDEAYLSSVCSPNITAGSTPIPPCISINTIQSLCKPNNTDSLGLAAHAQCMCNAPSSFFADWRGCRQCLFTHGGMTEGDLSRYMSVINVASTALCSAPGGTPTGDFQKVFASAEGAVPAATGASGGLKDSAPSQTAVSLYYTASGAQGSGVITGSATAATANGNAAATTGSAKSSGSGSSGGSATKSSAGSSATGGSSGSSSGSSSSKSGAMPTAAAGMGLAAAAGMVVLAAL